MTLNPDEFLASRTAIFAPLRARILSIAQRIVGNRADAEDIVQDTFVRWITSPAEDVRVPAAWFTTVATRLAIDHVRRARREREKLDATLVEEASVPSAQDTVERASQIAHGVRLLLERLNAEERAALLLHEAFDAEYASIAATLGRTPAHCRQIVHRAKTRLLDTKAKPEGRERANDEAVIALVDAIARQDRDAVIVSLRLQPAETIAEMAGARACAGQSAMHETAALIQRLRLGHAEPAFS